MPSPPKLFITGQAYLLTSRTEEGLPFVPLLLMNSMILSCLGKAARLHPVLIVAFVFMANHLHVIVIVRNPEKASAFMGYLKQEMSHALNRMLGRRQKTIWKDEYDSPILLSGDRCLEEMAYTLVNPCAANLVNKPEEYIGVTSIDSLNSDEATVFSVRELRRTSFTPLSNPARPYKEDSSYNAELLASTNDTVEITIDPWAIREVYPEFQDLSIEELREKLLFKIRGRTEEAREKRFKKNKSVVGATRLYQMSMLIAYRPTTFGRKSVCLGSSKAEVVDCLKFFRQLVVTAKEVYQRWKVNDFSVLYPIGMFPPHLPRTGNYLASILT